VRFKFRVTKFDPAKRNQLGHFMAEDWTSISDIGKAFNGQILVRAEYDRVENAYLDSIGAFLTDSRIDTLTIDKLEFHSKKFGFKVGQQLGPNEIRQISRLALQEELWCQLRNPRRAYLHFGYDYYVYIGVSRPCPSAIDHAHSLGLFVEPFWSPHLGRLSSHA